MVCSEEGPMAISKRFSDLLKDCQAGKRTGAVVVTVAEASDNLIRFYFHEGRIASISYGTAKDRDCLDIFDCYTPGKATYLDGMKAPSFSTSLPETNEIIERIERTGKQVQTDS